MFTSIASVAVVIALMTGFTHPAATKARATATGTYKDLTGSIKTLGTASGDTFFDEIAATQYEGGLTGIAFDMVTFVVHPDGTYVGFGTQTCPSCTIGGRTGNYVASYLVTGSGFDINASGGGPGATYSGTALVTRAGGGLAGLQGGGTFQSTAAGKTYSYTYSFASKR